MRPIYRWLKPTVIDITIKENDKHLNKSLSKSNRHATKKLYKPDISIISKNIIEFLPDTGDSFHLLIFFNDYRE
jgi:hypothetical protein